MARRRRKTAPGTRSGSCRRTCPPPTRSVDRARWRPPTGRRRCSTPSPARPRPRRARGRWSWSTGPRWWSVVVVGSASSGPSLPHAAASRMTDRSERASAADPGGGRRHVRCADSSDAAASSRSSGLRSSSSRCTVSGYLTSTSTAISSGPIASSASAGPSPFHRSDSAPAMAEPEHAPGDAEDRDASVGPAAQRRGEQLGPVDAERRHHHRAADRAGDRQDPHRPPPEQHHRHGQQRAGDHPDGPDDAPTPGVREASTDHQPDPAGGVGEEAEDGDPQRREALLVPEELVHQLGGRGREQLEEEGGGREQPEAAPVTGHVHLGVLRLVATALREVPGHDPHDGQQEQRRAP